MSKKPKTRGRSHSSSPRNIVHVQKVLGNIALDERHHDEDERPPAATSFRPAQLPAIDPDFLGRSAEISDVIASLGGKDSSGGAVSFSGPPGVGKTALVIRLAHTLVSSYPDAQLYVNLGDLRSESDDLEQILERLLRALGFSGSQISGSFEEKVVQYRSALAAQRCLLVLDNVSTEEQVRTLLPGSQGTATLITSRSNLAGLAGVKRVLLNTLDSDDSVRILEQIAGRSRVSAEKSEAKKIADLCGGLPLALRIAANRLKDRPAWTLAYFAVKLQDKRHVLQSLKSGDLAVRASFSLSYEGLNATEKMIFRRFGASPSSGASPALISSLCGLDEYDTEEILEQLCDANLLQPSVISGRYRAHDLIRVFCQERLREEEGGDAQGELVLKSVTWYAEMVQSASEALFEGEGVLENKFPTPQAATDWLEEELPALVESVTTAYDDQLDGHLSIAISGGLALFFERRSHVKPWLQVTSYGLLAARRENCKHCLVNALLDSFRATSRAWPEKDGPLEYLDEAYQLAQDLGSPKNESRVLYRLGLEARKRSHRDEAEKMIRRALVLAKSAKDMHQQGKCLMVMGDMRVRDEQFDEASENYRTARACLLSRRDRHCQGLVLLRMARLRLRLKQHDEAAVSARAAVKLFEAVHDIHCLGIAHRDLADIAADSGDLAEAREIYDAACGCFQRVNDARCWASALRSSAKIDYLDGREEEARKKRALAAEVESSSEGFARHSSNLPLLKTGS